MQRLKLLLAGVASIAMTAAAKAADIAQRPIYKAQPAAPPKK